MLMLENPGFVSEDHRCGCDGGGGGGGGATNLGGEIKTLELRDNAAYRVRICFTNDVYSIRTISIKFTALSKPTPLFTTLSSPITLCIAYSLKNSIGGYYNALAFYIEL